MTLSLRFEKKSNTDYLIFTGSIDEDAELVLPDLKDKLSTQCTFNLKAISNINSCGVRAWINFMREANKTSEITFEECPPEVVSQINMIPNFRGQARISSVYASYMCDACDHQTLVLYTHGENLPKTIDDIKNMPPSLCPKCNEAMEMEELEEEFFGWIEYS